MTRRLFSRLFYRNKKAQIPLLSRNWTSDQGRYETAPKWDKFAVQQLKVYRLARTDQDAYRLLHEYPGLPIKKIIKLEARKRKRRNIFFLAWRRLKRLW